jgi:LAO/AO transport system kinase
MLIDKGHRVAVLAVDPSSTVTRGSVLGDKTRMQSLARREECFIRPSPSGGTLGGVTRKTRETVLVCEAAGFDVVLIETVGVGQSEVAVRSMVDFFMLLKIAGAGDELQGIKKGVVELADAVVINKADGRNVDAAELARVEFERALHYLLPATSGWETRAFTCSALERTGIEDLWRVVIRFRELTTVSGVFQERRNDQTRNWMRDMIEDYLARHFYSHPTVRDLLPGLETDVISGNVPVTQAVRDLIAIYERDTGKPDR